MGDVHQLIIRQGVEAARQQATNKHERQLVEAAYQVLSEDAEKIGFTYSGFALTSLPHKLPKDAVWRREAPNLTMLLETSRDRTGHFVGLPYGSYARFILLFLQSEAIRTTSREIELGRSLHVWMGNMGLSIGGKSYRLVAEQAKRLSYCRLRFFTDQAGREIMKDGGFVEGAISLRGVIDGQEGFWQERVLLNEAFYQALREHPVPISDVALRAIGPKSLVIDTYIWLVYRLHAIKNNMVISWPALHAQFGAGVASAKNFRRHFIECLHLALAAYPDARVTIDERGVVLHNSRPAIAY